MKVPFDVDKRTWHPSVLPGPIVLVTTLNSQGVPNVAPKSWIAMMALNPPILVFGCNHAHDTAQNILKTREFVVNIPGDDLMDKVWAAADLRGQDHAELKKAGFTPMPSLRVSPPRLAECKAHLECVLDWIHEYGMEVAIFGRIVSASIDQDLLEGPYAERYARLRPMVYLEEGLYGVIEGARPARDVTPSRRGQ